MSNSSESSRRLLSLSFIVALAVLFALQWGPGSRGCDRAAKATPIADAVATVNGKEIPLREFQRLYANQLSNLRQQGIPLELAKQFGMHTQVLDRLVDGELLAQAAEERGVAASDDDVKETLLKDPAFQKDGVFDFERYQQVIRDYEGSTEIVYEQKLRRQLSAQHMLDLVASGVVVSDEEVKAKYFKDGNTAKVSFVKFSPTMFADKITPPKAAEMAAWTTKNEAEITAYYAKQKADFTTPEKVHARQILLKVARDDSADKKAEAKQRIENLRKELVDNKKPFAEIATGFSEDVETKAKGGDLGFVDRYALPPNFADLMFALKPGEVTLPVETPIGWLIGTIEAKQAAETKPLEAVKAQIASQLWTREKAKAAAKAEADKALADVKAGKKLSELYPASTDKFAAETKPEVKESGEFNSSAENVPSLGASPATTKAVFERKEAGLLEQVVSIDDSYAVVVVDERSVPSDANFDKEKEKLRLESIKGKQFEVREAFLKALKQTGSVVTNQKVIDKVAGEG